ncbi:MAG: hypothetical protein JWR00_1255 [Rubritepida sp.]|nr:hypothetical protein [Rubritepida sp.]
MPADASGVDTWDDDGSTDRNVVDFAGPPTRAAGLGLEVSTGAAELQKASGRIRHVSDELMLVEQRIRETAYRFWEKAGRPEGQEHDFWFQAEAEIRKREDKLDEALADSFPASDPPSSTVTRGTS